VSLPLKINELKVESDKITVFGFSTSYPPTKDSKQNVFEISEDSYN
jgi:hypothetical protein